MSDWLADNVLWLTCLFIAAVVAFCVWDVVYDVQHPCQAYGQPYYHAPIYVNTGGKYGGVMVPVGGGVYADCVKR